MKRRSKQALQEENPAPGAPRTLGPGTPHIVMLFGIGFCAL
jgi:hypothetical protein